MSRQSSRKRVPHHILPPKETPRRSKVIGSRKKTKWKKIHGNVKEEREIRKIARERTDFYRQHIQGQNKQVLQIYYKI